MHKTFNFLLVYLLVLTSVLACGKSDKSHMTSGDQVHPSGVSKKTTGKTKVSLNKEPVEKQNPTARASGLTADKLSEPSALIEKRLLKLDSRGKALKPQSQAEPTKFSCVKDQQSQLLWEVKVNDGSWRGVDKTFRWGGQGAEQKGDLFYEDWNVLLKEANNEKSALCGRQGWRVPSIEELNELWQLSNEKGFQRFFPNQHSGIYWSSTAYPYYPEHAQHINFANGKNFYYEAYRGEKKYIRLVNSNNK